MEPKFSTIERLSALAGLGIFSVGCFIVGFFNPSNAGFFPGCPLLDFTGFACPGCGLTRGFHALLHGDILTALDFNAIIPFFVLAFIYLVVLLGSIAIRGRGIKPVIFSPAALWFFTFTAVTFAVLRNIPVYPFEILFP